jgi:enolase
MPLWGWMRPISERLMTPCSRPMEPPTRETWEPTPFLEVSILRWTFCSLCVLLGLVRRRLLRRLLLVHKFLCTSSCAQEAHIYSTLYCAILIPSFPPPPPPPPPPSTTTTSHPNYIVSLAASKAGAAAKGVPLWKHYADCAGNPNPDTLPVPCFNVINGGEHAGNKLAFQEFFVVPTGATTFSESMEIGCEVFHNLKKVIQLKFGGDATLIGDEGGFAPPCDVYSGLDMIMEATEMAGYLDKVSVGLDVASSEFKVAGQDAYDLDFKAVEKDPSQVLTGDQMVALYKDLIDKYPIVTIEDPFDQDDWVNWSKIVAEVGEAVQIVGDDLTVTNPIKIQEAVDTKAANCLLLKVNQIGTISESIDAVKLSKQNGWGVMTSHRSGETEDNYIADLAVGLCTGQIKTGAPCRGERTAKYNQLLRIEEQLGAAAKYPGMDFRVPTWMA